MYRIGQQHFKISLLSSLMYQRELKNNIFLSFLFTTPFLLNAAAVWPIRAAPSCLSHYLLTLGFWLQMPEKSEDASSNAMILRNDHTWV